MQTDQHKQRLALLSYHLDSCHILYDILDHRLQKRCIEQFHLAQQEQLDHQMHRATFRLDKPHELLGLVHCVQEEVQILLSIFPIQEFLVVGKLVSEYNL
jgi:hypothetical protein